MTDAKGAVSRIVIVRLQGNVLMLLHSDKEEDAAAVA